MAKGLRSLVTETGLSLATVSRALNNSDKVTEKTRRIVLEAATRLGYTPNAAARALTTKRTRTIGAVIPTLENSIFSTFINALEDRLASFGYALVVATTNTDPDTEFQRSKELLDMGAEGLIVSGLEHNESFMDMVNTRNVPIVAISIFTQNNRLPAIGYDNRALGKMAAKYLLDLGHKKLGVIHGPLKNNDRTVLRIKGVMEIIPEAIAIEVPLSVSGGVEGARYLLSKDDRPSVILCLSDVLALGVLFEAPKLGFNIPEKLSVMGFDNLDWAGDANPPLTTIALPVVEMGQRSANAMVENLEFQKIIRSKRLHSDIVVRESTRRVRY